MLRMFFDDPERGLDVRRAHSKDCANPLWPAPRGEVDYDLGPILPYMDMRRPVLTAAVSISRHESRQA